MEASIPRKCNPRRISCVAKNLVNCTLYAACNLIQENRDGLFLYKRPSVEPSAEDDIDSDVPEVIRWVSIADFTLTEGMAQISEFIRRWELSPATKFVLEPRSEKDVPGRGKHFFVDALFSKPTYRCPNPLAVAVVHFRMHVSTLLPKSYPIMVTYRFEGYKSTYYALGERCVRSTNFQRFYIDTILHMKLSFYAKICECKHGDARERTEMWQARMEEEYDARSLSSSCSH